MAAKTGQGSDLTGLVPAGAMPAAQVALAKSLNAQTRLFKAQQAVFVAMRQAVIQQTRQQAQGIQAQKALAKAQQASARRGGPVQRALFTAIRSTRMNMGPVSPLIGRTLDALNELGPVGRGAALALGGIALTVSLAVGAVKLFAHIVTVASERLNELGDARRVSGGTAAQVAGLASFLPTGAIADMAARFREAITTDPQAMAMAGRMGVHARPGQYGDPNQAGDLQEVFRQLRAMGETEQQLARARVFGLESLLKFVNVSPQVAKAQEALAKTTGAITKGGAATRAADDFAAGIEVVKGAFANVISALGVGALKPITDGLLTFAASLGKVAEWFNANQSVAKGIGESFKVALEFISGLALKIPTLVKLFLNLDALLETALTGNKTGYAAVSKAVQGQFQALFSPLTLPDWNKQFGQQSPAVAATQKNTDATLSLVNALGLLQQGITGGGERAQNALGSGMRGDFLDRSMGTWALRFGAFSL